MKRLYFSVFIWDFGVGEQSGLQKAEWITNLPIGGIFLQRNICILTITINTPDQRQSNINLYFWTNDTLSTTIILLCSALIDSVDQVLPTT